MCSPFLLQNSIHFFQLEYSKFLCEEQHQFQTCTMKEALVHYIQPVHIKELVIFSKMYVLMRCDGGLVKNHDIALKQHNLNNHWALPPITCTVVGTVGHTYCPSSIWLEITFCLDNQCPGYRWSSQLTIFVIVGSQLCKETNWFIAGRFPLAAVWWRAVFPCI